ncbi:MAG TPA: TIGR00725 family protein [Actinomycetota bacterium]|nr:TIGR00725 family protein [Actinomycetota bacterium]
MGLERSPVYVGVVGPDPAPEDVAAQAEEVGRLLAKAGAVVVCGGLGGVMEAASRGAATEGGTSIGLLPGTSRGGANPYLTFSIPTGMGEMRNVLIVRASDAVIALAGEFGTLSEIAFALKTGVPVVGLETWELAKAGKPVEPFLLAGSPEEAVREALRLGDEAARHGTR